jgi:hypothetical protein
MSDAFHDFDNRLRRIQKSRVKLANGYVSVVGDDGLIVVKPRSRKTRFVVRPFLFLIVGLLFFKSLILATLGQPVYEERLAALQGGTTIEQAGAWVMQIDPASAFVAAQIRSWIF